MCRFGFAHKAERVQTTRKVTTLRIGILITCLSGCGRYILELQIKNFAIDGPVS